MITWPSVAEIVDLFQKACSELEDFANLYEEVALNVDGLAWRPCRVVVWLVGDEVCRTAVCLVR
jgi:hypothetical protein